MNPLIFVESVIEPPSENLAIRSLCILLTLRSDCDFLFETTEEMKDLYFRWIKRNGMHDFISELVLFEEKVQGYRISLDKCNGPGLIVNRIDYSNLGHVISSIPTIQ
jgi:hypothetical protein